MLLLRNRGHRARLIVVLAPAILIFVPLAYAQCIPSAASDYVGQAAGNPFSADRVYRSWSLRADGTEQTTFEYTEKTDRDGRGRIRFEKQVVGASGNHGEVTLTAREGQSSTVNKSELAKVILIFDCTSGTAISVQPGLHYARTIDQPRPGPTPRTDRPFSGMFFTLLGRNLPANLKFEDLGYRDIDGIQARGAKTTTLGSDEDGSLKGLPIREDEVWSSDDLAAMLLRITKDFKKMQGSRTVLTNIKRQEPDGTLFDVPAEYFQNPNPAQMPVTRRP
jgi:hypothetical protein